MPRTKKDYDQDKELKKLEKKVKKLGNEPEVKFVDEYSASLAVNNVGILNIPISPAPILGVGQNNRIGNEIRLTSWTIRYVLLSNANRQLPTRIRMIALMDNAFSGIIPPLGGAPGAILDSTVVTDLTLSPRNQNEIDRFKILYDKVYVFNNPWRDIAAAQGVSMGSFQQAHFKMNKKIRFIGNAGLLTDISGNCPIFYVVSDQPVVTDQPLISFSCRVRYMDV